jgi:hypothetical protein
LILSLAGSSKSMASSSESQPLLPLVEATNLRTELASIAPSARASDSRLRIVRSLGLGAY